MIIQINWELFFAHVLLHFSLFCQSTILFGSAGASPF
jgi:hypothetical protein